MKSTTTSLKSDNLQGFSGSPKIQLLPDGRRAKLLEEFSYRDALGDKHIAHRGFIFDGGSIPRFFWRIIGSPFTGVARAAYVIHDVDCMRALDIARDVDKEMGKAFRLKADLLFLEMLTHLGVSWWRRRAMYRAVRLHGIWVHR